jgi:excisionase family DNA binding protein
MNDTGIILLTIPETARALAIGRSTVYELIAAGELPVVHIRRSSRVRWCDVEEYVDRLQASEPVTPPS